MITKTETLTSKEKKDKLARKEVINPSKKSLMRKKLAGLPYKEAQRIISPRVQMRKEEYVKRTFEYLDVDKTQDISSEEMKSGFAKIAGEDQYITKGELSTFLKKNMGLWGPIASIAAGKIIEKLDEDRDGELNVTQLIILAEGIFKELDKDKNNKVTREEFQKIIDILKQLIEERGHREGS